MKVIFKNPTKKQDVFIYLIKRFLGDKASSLPTRIFKSVQYYQAFFSGFVVPVLHLSNNILNVNHERRGGNETRCSEDT